MSAPHDCEWKDAVLDACVVDWVLTAEHENDPQKAVNDLLCWQQRLALDPAVSEPAAKLHARVEELESTLSAIRALVQRWREEAAHAREPEVDDYPFAAGKDECADQLAALCPAPPEDRK